MGKKKGKGKKGKKGKKPGLEGVPLVELTRKQLLKHVLKVKEEMDLEKEDREFFMMEREKYFNEWLSYMEQIIIEKAKVEELKDQLKDTNKVKAKEENKENQRLCFLKMEQTRKLGQLRILHLQQMTQAQDDAWLLHMVLKKELMNKKREIRRAQMSFYQLIRGLHWKHSKQVSDLRDQFAREIRRLETTTDRSLFEKNERDEEKQSKEMAKMGSDKDEQVRLLVEDHAWQIDQMKAFFNELLKRSLEVVNQMKIEVKQQITAELMRRRDYENFKHQYDLYVAPALRWKALMEEWTIVHQEDDLVELMRTLKMKERELEKRKYGLRMLEATNEALNQRILIAEKERNCVKRQFGRAVVDSQRTASMKRFVQQLKRKAAGTETDLYETLNKTITEQTDDFSLAIDKKDKEMFDHLIDINDYAVDHANTNRIYADAFRKNEISLAELGYPVKGTGVRPVPQQDLDQAIFTELEKRAKRYGNIKGASEELTLKRVSERPASLSLPSPTETAFEPESYETEDLEWGPEEIDVVDVQDYYEEIEHSLSLEEEEEGEEMSSTSGRERNMSTSMEGDDEAEVSAAESQGWIPEEEEEG